MVVLSSEDGMRFFPERFQHRFCSGSVRRDFLALAVITSLAFGAAAWRFYHSGPEPRVVIAYCAQDQVYAEEIFRDFENRTGIKVKAVFDSEAVKTAGIANRLLAERSHPQCDVFWGNEEMHTRQLARQNVFRAENGWAAFGRRFRRLVINTNQVAELPSGFSLQSLTNGSWTHKVALAYPQFGTTAAHLHGLRQRWGDETWRRWCAQLAANQPLLLDGNSAVVRAVGRGDAWIGLTDSDDIAAGEADHLPIRAVSLEADSLSIPNTVAVIRDAPHPNSAQTLFAFLQTPGVAERLIQLHALENNPAKTGGDAGFTVDWKRLLDDLDGTTQLLNRYFLR
jgi:iron(III) transport system substrate-binding protein